ncbi:GerAB/ArcD/ProY family transporter [Salipaludibacillus agaradhaerens]|uniref:GerAB/ArcD/ProY family transporter n=1 Tax=Salipaludibacillus agaradhaerens TaxID=76935 RepID=A0A9Q4FXR2_SALAG|nr:spore germination protein [Salipaludibacillus agaradhaerens]MCR6095596.1 GerAB/ArcD/ProY family transporter [Salipaludibacillus agaradhaerens]MCR6114844.1 GerAB/ArcD/ProY family transporter [Salipaludibacillus agaradhaerens]
MISHPKDKITTPQTVVFITSYNIAIGILTLPRVTVEEADSPDVWITVILGAVIAFISGIIIVKLSQQFVEKTFYQYSQDIVGNLVGKAFSMLFIIYFLTLSALEIRVLAEVTGFYLLENTPGWAMIIPMMWAGIYLISGGINPLVRLLEIIFPFTVIIFMLVLFMSYNLFEIDNLRPVLGLGVAPALKAIKTTALSYTCFESLLFLVAFMKHPGKAVKVVVIATIIPLVFYLLTVVMVIGVFSIDGVVTRVWPTIDLITSYELRGLIFERFDSLLLAVWVMQIFATFIITYFAGALGFAQVFNKNISLSIYIVLPVVYIIAMIPKDLNDIFTLGDWIGNSAIFLFGTVPLLLLIITKLKGGKVNAKI